MEKKDPVSHYNETYSWNNDLVYQNNELVCQNYDLLQLLIILTY